MMYASRTLRDLNHDPHPWRDQTGRYSTENAYWSGFPRTFDPRPEFDHAQHNPVNRLLRDFRAIDGGRGEYARWLRDLDANPHWWTLQPGTGIMAGVTVGYAPEEIAHARRVLTRLANLAEKEQA